MEFTCICVAHQINVASYMAS